MSYDIEVAKLIIVVVGIIFLLVGGVCLPLIWNKRFWENRVCSLSQVTITMT